MSRASEFQSLLITTIYVGVGRNYHLRWKNEVEEPHRPPLMPNNVFDGLNKMCL